MARAPRPSLEGADSTTSEPAIEIATEPAPPVSVPADPVRVMLLCNHVFLPKDPTQPGWETSSETVRYEGETDGRRTKINVHPGLAEFLQGRKQAEILD